jgi:hypothetical protein
MPTPARGPFDLKLIPMTPDDDSAAATNVGRMTIEKTFHGDLEGTSKGQMLAIRTGVENSAGYVAMERVTATLHGKSGTFALQHSGVMTRGARGLTVTVVPDSGTGELVGISGKMDIQIEGGKHSYELEYAIR